MRDERRAGARGQSNVGEEYRERERIRPACTCGKESGRRSGLKHTRREHIKGVETGVRRVSGQPALHLAPGAGSARASPLLYCIGRRGRGSAVHTGGSAVPTGTSAAYTGGAAVHTGGGAVHTGGSAVHTGGAAVHTGGSVVHTGASAVHTGGSEQCPGSRVLVDNVQRSTEESGARGGTHHRTPYHRTPHHGTPHHWSHPASSKQEVWIRLSPKGCEEKHSYTTSHHPVVRPPAVVSTAVSHTPTQQQGW